MSVDLTAILLLSLRLAPTFGFAQPFTLLRLPALVRILIGIALSATMVAAMPQFTSQRVEEVSFFSAAIGEIAIGLSMALCLNLAFAGMLWAGRALDIQAGFGLAMVADPTTQAQLPLAGTILAYGGAIVFFLTGAHYELLALWAASVEYLPIGYGGQQFDIAVLSGYLATIFSLSLGLVGVAMLVIFLLDLAIAAMSRTLPQMNVLLLGFQVKSLAMLLVLPISLALAAGIYLRMFRLAFESAMRLMGTG